MIDRQKRDVAAAVLRRFLDGAIANDEFVALFPRDRHDRALRGIAEGVWGHYSDLHRHALTGTHAPKPDARALLERCWLFLGSDLEFEWPMPVLSIPAGFLSLITFGWVARQYEKRIARLGDYDVWPFLRKSDYEAVVSSQLPLGHD